MLNCCPQKTYCLLYANISGVIQAVVLVIANTDRVFTIFSKLCSPCFCLPEKNLDNKQSKKLMKNTLTIIKRNSFKCPNLPRFVQTVKQDYYSLLCFDCFFCCGDPGQEPGKLWQCRTPESRARREQNGDAVYYAVVGSVMDARSASLFLRHHPSSQVPCKRYYFEAKGRSR